VTLEVLIPCFDGEAVVERAVASVFAQTRPAERVTVHDDASRDGTVRVLEGLQARYPALRVLRSARNRGILGARQVLVRESDADVLCFLDHDDAWPADYLEHVLAAYREPKTVATVAPARSRDGRGRVTGRTRLRGGALRASAHAEAVRRLLMEYPVPSWSCVTVRRREALRLLELSGFPAGEEFPLLALALEAGDVQLLDRPVVERHFGAANASGDPSKQHEAELALLRWFTARYPWLAGDVPAKVTAIYANSVYRCMLAGDRARARSMLGALFRGLLHPKIVGAAGAFLAGPRVLRWLKPPR
jgi:glycosyltransferase involved in cell wall biosynthesis